MKKILFISLLSSFTLLGCFAPSMLQQNGNTYTYTHKLVGDNVNGNTFNDGKLAIEFTFSQKELDFEMKNLTSDPIKIIWDEVSFVQYGEGKRIFHKGVKYTERNNPQVPTIIPSGTTYSDLICPTDNVYFSQGYYVNALANEPSQWITHDLWITSDRGKLDVEQHLMQLKGWKYS